MRSDGQLWSDALSSHPFVHLMRVHCFHVICLPVHELIRMLNGLFPEVLLFSCALIIVDSCAFKGRFILPLFCYIVRPVQHIPYKDSVVGTTNNWRILSLSENGWNLSGNAHCTHSPLSHVVGILSHAELDEAKFEAYTVFWVISVWLNSSGIHDSYNFKAFNVKLRVGGWSSAHANQREWPQRRKTCPEDTATPHSRYIVALQFNGIRSKVSAVIIVVRFKFQTVHDYSLTLPNFNHE